MEGCIRSFIDGAERNAEDAPVPTDLEVTISIASLSQPPSPQRTSQRLLETLVLPALFIIVQTLGTAAGALAQDQGHRGLTDARLDSITRRVESIEPRSGPPGTEVTIHTGGMPAVTPLRIGMGAVRFGFEEIGQVLTNEKGEFTLTVEVPSWGRRDLIHRFIVFDFYFVPIALSDIFHVTDTNGMIERVGQLVTQTGRCAILRADDGLHYALTGDLPAVEAGARIVVEGRVTTSHDCGQETTVEVTRIVPDNSGTM